jgi:hypothetical protein
MYDKTTQKRARTMAIRAGLIVSNGDDDRRTPKANTVKAVKLPVWAFGPDKRQARYDSQPTYWAGKASAKQRERCTEQGVSLPRKATAQFAAEAYAKAMCKANGVKFQPLP